ncbi:MULTISPECIES: carboxylesterase family protein [unclassified Corynebacterium]|uniref:carboxylesterase family protein n=1 Tax=unclassified Corynebacterium TaxID=2624378 RepID=UPI0029CA2032|nr:MULTISPECIES: carboxylesterase family protein [unclassified Corynebacterium]WPF65556.1 carboxylesterase family protein [Corynebacterium sp. 22KM0430]WPF68051.1 carboxylesterase family protein [Corynebacterium sp. 21KM1197]
MSTAPSTVTIRTPEGRFRGIAHRTHAEFSSIQFCTIPGPFEDSRPKRGTPEQLIDATVPHPKRIALSITAPPGATFGDDLPVMVYIHGGSYDSGNHEEQDSKGTAMAQAGIIVVRLGYRTGLPGFAHFSDDEDHHYRGVADCQWGLEWVQRCIEYFGGDPTNVTLVGQSAGAGIALWLSRRDHYQGAFRRLIAMSPAYPRTTFDKRKGTLRRLIFTPITRRHLTELHSKNPAALRRGYRRFRSRFFYDLTLGPGPFAPNELVNIPMLVTCTREECFNFVPAVKRLDQRGRGGIAVRVMAKAMGLEIPASSYLESARKVYPHREMSQLISDSAIRRWVSDTAENAPAQCWVLQYEGDEEHPMLHCDDLRLVFRPDPARRSIHRIMVDFARGDTPAWPRYQRTDGRKVKIYDAPTGQLHTTEDPLKPVRLAFHHHIPWKSAGAR